MSIPGGSCASTSSGLERADREACVSCSTAACSTPRSLRQCGGASRGDRRVRFRAGERGARAPERPASPSGPCRLEHPYVPVPGGRQTGQRCEQLSQESGIVDVSAAFEAAIEHELGDARRQDLRGPASVLSERYRSGEETDDSHGFAPGQLQRLPGDAGSRPRSQRPAECWPSSARCRPAWAPQSILDLGAGPGTATWAAVAVFPSIEHAELVEREPDMAALGVRLARSGAADLLADAVWTIGRRLPGHMSKQRPGCRRVRSRGAGRRAGAPGARALVGGDPRRAGTRRARHPGGLRTAPGRQASAHLLGRAGDCPLPARRPLPHGGLRLVSFRRAPGAVEPAPGAEGSTARIRGREVLLSGRVGEPAPRTRSPVGASPRPHKGHVRVWLCETGGLGERVISRSNGEIYGRARRARWGDRLD